MCYGALVSVYGIQQGEREKGSHEYLYGDSAADSGLADASWYWIEYADFGGRFWKEGIMNDQTSFDQRIVRNIMDRYNVIISRVGDLAPNTGRVYSVRSYATKRNAQRAISSGAALRVAHKIEG